MREGVVKEMIRRIISVTMNPSIDVTLYTDGLKPDETNRVLDERREAGGKGINVSRVAHSFGLQTLCLSIVGRDNSREFSGYLEQESLPCENIPVNGAVRENLTLRYNGNTLKLNRKGPSVSAVKIGALIALIERRVRPGDIVVFAGSLPENISTGDYVELILAVKKKGVLIAIDNDIFTLEQYVRISPWLIKPNIHELRHIVKTEGDDPAKEAHAAAKILCGSGVENVLVSLGKFGMVYVAKGIALRAVVPEVEVKSTVGAGDSSLAGFIIGFIKECAVEECVRLAAACGTACVMREGTSLATRETADAVKDLITVEKLRI